VKRGHWVYLARCRDGSYYCGYAVDPQVRIAAHNRGNGAKSVRGRLPVRLVYARRLATLSAALRWEASLKRRSHREKQALVRRGGLRARGRAAGA
jgi:putative endonuclease